MVENTSKRHTAVHYVGKLDGPDDYLDGMEAAGQRQLVASSLLPVDGPWGDLEALGFVRGEAVADDPLFVYATIPEGWRKEAIDNHPMGSRIVDERGIGRVTVFYKAAYYDRRADFQVVRVGVAAANILYHEGPAILPDKWDMLTDTERREYAAELDRKIRDNRASLEALERAGRDGSYFEDLLARVLAFQAVLPVDLLTGGGEGKGR